jgi:preprotein translocase subunit SecF
VKIIRFSKGFVPAAVISVILIAAGLAGYFTMGGFNLGIDFQAGLLQEVQFAPNAISITYDGAGNAVINVSRTTVSVAISGVGVQGQTSQFLMSDYGTVGAFAQALSQIEGVTAQAVVPSSTPFRYLILDALGNPALSETPSWIHYVPVNAEEIPLDEVRSSLASVGEVNVQILGAQGDNNFMIRMQDSAMKESVGTGKAKTIEGSQTFDPKNIPDAIQAKFGAGEVAVTNSNMVGSRFSQDLTKQAAWLLAATLLLILIYASIRFKPQYAIGAVLAILHDGLIIVAFVVWTRMEFNTTTIAAILTILGYSINDTIVIFDRIRETRKIYPDDNLRDIMDRSITETLSRTFITTLTTMLAVVSLYVFTTGSMKDFALALLVGMVSGVYSTIYIASGFVLFWDRFISKGKAEKPGTAPEPKAA